MSKYKTNSSTTSTTDPNNTPIWCYLSSPSQIARKYASIAPIWCHISRPRQLKKKFQSTFQQAQNLLTRPGSKDTANRNGYVETIKETPTRDQDKSTSAISATDTGPQTYLASNNKYEYLAAKYRDTSLDTKPVANSRWVTANVRQSSPPQQASRYGNQANDKPMKTQAKANQDHVGSPMTTSTAESNKAFSKRVLKPSKYSHRYTGAKTDRIGYKTSKSSPNLLYKDLDDELDGLNDRSSHNTTTAMINGGTTPTYSSSTYLHSNPLGAPHTSSNHLYHNHHNNNINNSSSSHQSSNKDGAYSSNYPSAYMATPHQQQQRELKWNELDSMLGAQSALLNRLESDFVANRTKLKAAVNITSTTVNTYPSSTMSSSLMGPTRNSYTTTTNATSDILRPKFNPNRYVSNAISHVEPYKVTASVDDVHTKPVVGVDLSSPVTDPTKTFTDTVKTRKVLKYGGSASDRKTTILSDIVGSHDVTQLSNKSNGYNQQPESSIVDLIKDFNIVDSNSTSGAKSEAAIDGQTANVTKSAKTPSENTGNGKKYGEHEYLPQALTSNVAINKV
jgi:hypothetical protein